MRHIKAISIETQSRELTLGQWLGLVAEILGIIGQALLGKESAADPGD